MFSIVIPVYNAKVSLERCVDSWLCQTRKDLEIILVDDGSSDGSKELCDRLAKNNSGTCVRVIHQANSGVSAARNAGIRAAEGEFLLFTDSDDYVEPDYLEKMAALQENSDADLVLCGYHHLYDGADIVKVPGETHVSTMAEFQQEFLELYKKSDLNMPWNKLYRKELFAGDPLLRFEEGTLFEDVEFSLYAVRKAKKIVLCTEKLYFYMQRKGSIMGSRLTVKKMTDSLKVQRKRIHFLQQNQCIAAAKRCAVDYEKYAIRFYFSAGETGQKKKVRAYVTKCFLEMYAFAISGKEISKRDRLILILFKNLFCIQTQQEK